MTTWRDCVKDPSEIGKKVLCQQNGDFYVAVRFEQYYIPIPFADHYFCDQLCFPQTWCEIDFPKPFTGHFRICPAGHDKVLKMSEAREQFPEFYKEFSQALIDSIAMLPKPK